MDFLRSHQTYFHILVIREYDYICLCQIYHRFLRWMIFSSEGIVSQVRLYQILCIDCTVTSPFGTDVLFYIGQEKSNRDRFIISRAMFKGMRYSRPLEFTFVQLIASRVSSTWITNSSPSLLSSSLGGKPLSDSFNTCM